MIPVPLFFELTMETINSTIPEASAASLLSIVSTFVQVLFLLLAALVPNVGSAWMNWLITATLPFSVIGLVLWKAQYPRLEKDVSRSFQVARVDAFGIF